MHLLYVFIMFALSILTAVTAVAHAQKRFGRGSRGFERAANFAVLFVTLLIMGVAAECYYYLFPPTDGFGFTKSNQRWHALYWKPVNELGYRDAPFDPAKADQDHLIVALGDSFTAGNGVKDVADRFSNVLESQLGPPWRVLNVASPGWDTSNQLEALKALPVQPRLVVLAYFPNDIKHAVLAAGGIMVEPTNAPPTLLGPLVEHSYAVNYAYWWGYRVLSPRLTERAFLQRIGAHYEDAALWEPHKAVLTELVSYTNTHAIRLLVLYLPQVLLLDENPPIVEKVLSVAREGGAEVFDLTPVFEGRDPSSLTVNRFDAHYNCQTHREIGALLAEFIRERGLLDAPSGS